MVSRIKGDLAGRIGQYINLRRREERASHSFAEALSHETRGYKAEPGTQPARRPHIEAGRGRGGRPGRVLGGAGRPLRGHARYITKAQALRLAGYAGMIQEASRIHRVPVELICAVILQESGGNRNAVSHCGAKGLMQLMPATARRLGVANSFDPLQNVMGGAKYLRMLLDRFGGNVALALAGYNAGEGNVERYGMRIPPFRETRAYVPNVLRYADTIWGILRTPVMRVALKPTIHHRTIYNVSRKA